MKTEDENITGSKKVCWTDFCRLSTMRTEDETITAVLRAARFIQDFLWADMNKDCGLEEFKRMFRKRIAKIDAIDMSNPHWKVELKKRVLQTAAISVNLITKLENDKITHDGIHPTLPSNLADFANEKNDTHLVLEKETP